MIASDLAIRLGRQAEAVCRFYLSSGRRSGKYWIVGDARNAPGRSLFVRLTGPETGRGAAGKWIDAASAEHGDLLDIIRESAGLVNFREVVDEARRFLSLAGTTSTSHAHREPALRGSRDASRRLFAMAQPILGTLAETYLRHRGLTALEGIAALRFHPRCYYRPDDSGPTQTWPALVAAVTDLHGTQTGAHRTWLAANGLNKAPVETPRRAMGDLLGHAVRFGKPAGVMAAGEGIETVLSLRCVLPEMPMAAALSAAHLGAILFPPSLRRLYIVCDNDAAGDMARDRLIERARRAGVDPIVMSPALMDFNDDLRRFGIEALRASVKPQLSRCDRIRYLRDQA
jgi:hypothetical protein